MIKKVEMFTCECDNCGADANKNTEFSCWTDSAQAREVAMESDWHETDDGKHYCPDCFSFDDDDNLVITGRVVEQK